MKEKHVIIKMIRESIQFGFNQTVESFFSSMVLVALRFILTGLTCNLFGVAVVLTLSFALDFLFELAKKWADDCFSKGFAFFMATICKGFLYFAIIFL